MRFEHITIRDGLPENSVMEILQDYQGFLWFATQFGPVKYDGYRFTAYSSKLSDTNKGGPAAYTLYEDKLKNLWIPTVYGLSRYDRENDSMEYYSLGSNEHWTYSMCEDDYGYLYFGSDESKAGLYKFDIVKKTYTQFFHNPSDSNSIGSDFVKDVYKEDSTTIWIGTLGGGLNKFDLSTQTFTCYKKIPGNPNSISSNNVYSIYKDKAGNLWIGTNRGLNKFNKLTETFTLYSILPNDSVILQEHYIYDMCEDTYGNLWLAVSFYGLVKFDPGSGISVKYIHDPGKSYTLSGNNLESIFEDRSGVLWVGNWLEGLNKFDEQKSRFVHFNNIIGNNYSDFIWYILEDPSGVIWIGTTHGLSKFDRESNSFINFNKIIRSKNKLTSEDIRNLYIDRKGYFWIGTRNGLNKFDTKSGKLSNFLHIEGDTNSISNNWITNIYEDSKENLWIGTTNGLNLFDRKNETFKVFYHDENDTNSISDNWISCIYEDSNKDLWFGTNLAGLNKFNREKKSFRHYIKGFSTILSIFEDKKGRFWIGTYMNGLYSFDRNTGAVTSFTEKEGLVYNLVHSILEDNSGNLWIGTQNGLSRFNPETGKIKNFDKNDLPVTDFRKGGSLKDKNGFLYFGGDCGFIMFHPDSIKDNDHIPEIVLTEFMLSNIPVKPDENSPLKKNINIAEEINLTYKENDFSLEFAALDYRNPMKNKYAYKLEGFNPDWIYTDAQNRTATYTNLDPGEYTFLVKGSNNDGVWNENGTSIKIIITPPFWITWWFRLCMILIILGSIVFVFKERIKKIKKEKNMQEEFTRQLISAHEDERKRIAKELHDSLSQNLLVIKNKAVLGLNSENKTLFYDISDLSSSTLQEIREISYNLHPYQLERLGLTKAIKSVTERTLKSTDIDFNVDSDIIDKIFNPEEEINIFRIIQECINNIIKHSDATKAELLIKRQTDKVQIMISDNGKGFDINALLSDKLKRGFGLMDITERAKIFKGIVEFESIPGKGTKCIIKIPLINEINK